MSNFCTISYQKNQTVIWVKPLTNDCYLKREPDTQPPLCSSVNDTDVVWGAKMKACISHYSDQASLVSFAAALKGHHKGLENVIQSYLYEEQKELVKLVDAKLGQGSTLYAKNIVLSIGADKTDEVELRNARAADFLVVSSRKVVEK